MTSNVAIFVVYGGGNDLDEEIDPFGWNDVLDQELVRIPSLIA